ncbi:MAG TPA: hypothetical protein PLS49_04805 [Candidatus Woesebacteria bacterium]|nr:hypothetical protein [Candidatus Woesebacteria bacterium]
MKKPYLVIPTLIEQPTWGGDYILKIKNWQDKPALRDLKIGQSYELYGNSLLTKFITNSSDPVFSSTLTETVTLSSLVEKNPEQILGKKIFKKYGNMPLLIKLNQARGNSFQLHVKPGTQHSRWKPKPESWYFLEDGYISCGIKKGINISTYKQCCVNIEGKMRELSNQVLTGQKDIKSAREEAQKYIKEQNPWQFINLYKTNKYDLIDLSQGGVHHSWEENSDLPLGNIVYEVQVDVMDEFCTIRGFDQGKIKDDGSIREIHVNDYFEFMDTSLEMNNINNLKRTRQGNNLLQTPYYSLDILELENKHSESLTDSFHHIYVQEGRVEIVASEGSIVLTKGHSCFIPYETGTYTITPQEKSTLLKTYISI